MTKKSKYIYTTTKERLTKEEKCYLTTKGRKGWRIYVNEKYCLKSFWPLIEIKKFIWQHTYIYKEFQIIFLIKDINQHYLLYEFKLLGYDCVELIFDCSDVGLVFDE